MNLKASTVWFFIFKGWCCHSRRRLEWQHHASTFLSPFLATPSLALWFGRSTPPPARPRRLPAALSRCRLLARSLAARLPAPPASARLLPARLPLACPPAGLPPVPLLPPVGRSSPALLPGVRSRLAIAHVTQGCLPHTWVALWVLAGRGKLGCRALLVSVVLCGPIFLRVAPNLSWLRSGWRDGRAGAGWVGPLGGLGRRVWVGAGCPPNAQLAAWTLDVIRALPPLGCTLYSPAVVSAPAP